MDNQFGIVFDLADNDEMLMIEAVWEGKRVSGAKFTPEEVDRLIAGLQEARSQMKTRST